MLTPPKMECSAAETTSVVNRQAAERPDAIAILGRDRTPLTYAGLASLVATIGNQLRGYSLGPNDRVAIVLPNGPEMATCFLCVAGVATAAPLNPAYRRAEFDFYLGDLGARALLVARGIESPSRDAAQALGIPIIELETSSERAGLFTLSAPAAQLASNDSEPRQTAALVLHTSGTTARPKIVPLTQANLCASARNIVDSLHLTAADRCLNIMPLFHIHGLIGALLSTIHAGGSILCENAFDAARCLDHFENLRPTWYTAVPTMHQAIIAAASRGDQRPRHSLRFIRSCSSALPPTVMAHLEKVFGVPVVEAYGMTEASHQMTCNPLPPRARKPGSVGVPAGVEVAIMGPAGRLQPAGTVGEVVIRGPNVTSGYEDNPQANFTAFEHGWFHTGDQGRLDDEGYLFLTGRIKELINRGGEKISPREIDEALLTHPDVAQAMAFALPHLTLGEDIAAAVVPRGDRTIDVADIRQHTARLLAEFKVPRRVIVVAEIPKGPTGKPQRIGLAEKLGLTGDLVDESSSQAEPPRTATEQRLAALWAEALAGKTVARTDGFFDCGGDSLSATLLLALIEKQFNVALPVRTLFEAGTLADMAAAIERLPQLDGAPTPRFQSLVPFQTAGNRPPFFMVHGHSGRSIVLGNIAPLLDADQPYYGFAARGMDGRRVPHGTIADMAAAYVKEIRTVQPRGPYLLGGYCAGGLVALEMAQQLLAAGDRVAQLVFFDAAHPSMYVPPPKWLHAARSTKLAVRRLLMRAHLAAGRGPAVTLGERIVNEMMRRGAASYRPQPYAGRITLFRSDVHPRSTDAHLGWLGVAADGIDLRPFPGNHADRWTRERIAPAARALQACLHEALATTRRAA